MYYLDATTLLSSGSFFKKYFSSRSISYSSLTRLVSSLLLPTSTYFQTNQGLTAPWRKICHFIFQYNQERMCPAPVCPFGGNIAMLQRFNCANRVWRIPKAMSDWELCDNKTSLVYLFFIQIYKFSIFWLTTDNFHFRNLFSGALMFCFFSNYWWLKRTAQTVTLLEKSGIVWSHTGLETFLRRKCKGLWERNNRCVLHSQNSHNFKSKIVLLISFTPLCFFVLFDVCLDGFFCTSHREILLVYATQSERIVASNIFKLFYNQKYVMM